MRAEVSGRSVEDVGDHEARAWSARVALVALHRHRHGAGARARRRRSCRIQRPRAPPPAHRYLHLAGPQLAAGLPCLPRLPVTAPGTSHARRTAHVQLSLAQCPIHHRRPTRHFIIVYYCSPPKRSLRPQSLYTVLYSVVERRGHEHVVRAGQRNRVALAPALARCTRCRLRLRRARARARARARRPAGRARGRGRPTARRRARGVPLPCCRGRANALFASPREKARI